MSTHYEPSLARTRVRAEKGSQTPPPNPLAGLRGGARCPRPHCGGLLLVRAVVTHDGSCEEVYCASCSRASLLAVLEPYTPIPEGPDSAWASLLVPEPDPAPSPDTDDSVGRALPASVRASVALHIACLDESLR
jgi:hypothetical protein